MLRFNRIPAAAILILTLTIGVIASVRASSRHSTANLEQKVASGAATPDDWLAYGEQLAGAKQHKEAASAFQHVLKTRPTDRKASVGRALALAQANDKAETIAFMRELLSHDAKLANDLLGRPEFQPRMSDADFVALRNDARAQAMD